MKNKLSISVVLSTLLLSSCAANRDVIRSMQETTKLADSPQSQVTVTVDKAPAVVDSSSILSAYSAPYVPYKKFPDIPGIDWTKKVQFSFKEEDVTKLLEFLSNASGITVVNIGGDVSTTAVIDPQSQQSANQAANYQQQFYGAQQQQQQKPAEPTKKIGPASGNVTVYSKGQVTLDEAFKILDVVLLGKGYATVFTGNVMKVVPVAGLRQSNLKIVVNGDPALATEGDDVVLQIIPLKNLTAAKVRSDISSMIPVWGMILSNDASNSLIMINSLSNIKTLLNIIDSLERASTRSLNVAICPLKFADSKNMASVLNQVFNGTTSATSAANQQFNRGGPQFGLGGTSQPGETITIVAETTSNSIVAVATPQTLALIRQTLDQLDHKQGQVLVEVLIVDVTLNHEFQLGVEWNLPGLAKLGDKDYTDTFSTNLGLAAKTPAFNYTLMNGDTRAFLNALMTVTKVDVKAAPRILTLDNQRATINIGQQVPNVTGSQTTSSGQVLYTYNYNTVGTILNVTPHINKDDYINLTLDQTVSKITQTTYFGAPVLDSRIASTSVRVKNGETMVLGGIMTDSETVTENKVPILGDLPLIGFLFNSSDTTHEKNELLIFLTPRIIETAKDSGDAINAMEEKIKKLR